MPAEAPPTSLPLQPADPVPAQTGTTSQMGATLGVLLKGLAAGLGITPESAATFVGDALRPIIRQEIQDAFTAFKDTMEKGEKNDALQADFPDGNPFDAGSDRA